MSTNNTPKSDILKILFGEAADRQAHERWEKTVKLAIKYKLWEKANPPKDMSDRNQEISLAQKEIALNDVSKPTKDLFGLASTLIKISGFQPHLKTLENIILAGTGISFSYEAAKVAQRLIEKNRLEEHKRLIVSEVRWKMRDRERWIAFKKSLKTKKQKTR